MIYRVFSIFDVKTEVFSLPFFAFTVPQAIRSVRETVNSGDATVSRFPEDFVLYELGSYDDSTGFLVSLPAAHSVVCARELLDSVDKVSS